MSTLLKLKKPLIFCIYKILNIFFLYSLLPLLLLRSGAQQDKNQGVGYNVGEQDEYAREYSSVL